MKATFIAILAIIVITWLGWLAANGIFEQVHPSQPEDTTIQIQTSNGGMSGNISITPSTPTGNYIKVTK